MPALTAQLVDHWRLEETSGNRTGSHAGTVLTDTNTVTMLAGKVGNGADFESANAGGECLASTNALFALGADTPFTWAMWFKAESFLGLSHRPLVIKSTAGDATSEYQLYWLEASERFEFMVGNGSSWQTVIYPFMAANAGFWHLLFAWHDPVLDRLYLQVDDATPNFATWAGGTINNGVGAMNIGRFPFSNGLRWDGMLDEVSFWKRVLTPEERAWLYNAGAGRSWPWSYVPAPISGAATFAGVSGMSALPPVRLRGGTASFSAHSDMAAVGTIATTRNYVWPPGKPKGNWFILDCRLGDSRVLFDRRSLTHFGNAREVIIEMREAGGLTEAELSESGYIRLRSLSLGAYVETFEKEL